MGSLTKSSRITFCRGLQAQADDPVTGFALVDGQVIFTVDTCRIYFDHPGDDGSTLVRELVSGDEPVIATATQVGLVKPGSGMSVAADGALSVNFPSSIDEATAFAISLIV